MKNRASKVVLIALFLALLYVPTLIGLLAGDAVKSENLENRVLTALPEPSLENLNDLPEQYEAYYADNQPFRDQLIYIRALMNKALYNRDVSKKVVFGKDDWLFYCAQGDGAPIDSYRGEDQFTNVELRQIAANLTRARDDLKTIGCDFVLFIAPNKERVYSEYMPDRFGDPAENYGVTQLVRFLRQRTDLKVVYAYDDIMQGRQDLQDIPLYFSKDTHWNGVGSYIGTRALMRAMGYELPELTREMISRSDSKGPYDLAVLSHLTPIYEKENDYDVFLPQDLPLPADSEKKRIYFRHDSFGMYMASYMTPWFSADSQLFVSERDDEQVDALHPDVFVMEVLERFVRRRLWMEQLYATPEHRQVEAQPVDDPS